MNYKALVFDLDGTLYHQLPVRIFMALWLLMYYFLRPRRVREILLLITYRKLRENRSYDGCNDFEAMQIQEAARQCNISPEEAQKVITLWMIHKPLRLIKFFRRRRLIEVIRRFQDAGKTIIVYSDYPVHEKLEALTLKPDYSYWSTDGIINCMKPAPEGLLRIIDMLGTDKKDILYIGDREEKDGLCAYKAGVDYLDVREFERIINA